MINTKSELREFIECELKGYKLKNKFRILFLPCFKENKLIAKFQLYLRYEEYYLNTGKKIRKKIFTYLRIKQGRKCGFAINPNNFDKGLQITHIGHILVNSNARIGKNCWLHINVNIVAGNHNLSPTIGDNCYIGVGSTILGNIKIADKIVIGANSLVNKSFLEENITIAGNPAKKINDHGRDYFRENKILI